MSLMKGLIYDTAENLSLEKYALSFQELPKATQDVIWKMAELDVSDRLMEMRESDDIGGAKNEILF